MNNYKRKNNNFSNVYIPIMTNKYKLYDTYNNSLNCDKLVIMDNHICFDALINKENMCVLINFININFMFWKFINNFFFYIIW